MRLLRERMDEAVAELDGASAPGHVDVPGGRDVRLYVLDGFRVEVGGIPFALASSGQRLLAFLALRTRVSRSEAAGTLWSSGTEAHAQGCLRTTLWRLRRLPQPMLDDDGPLLRLRPDVRVDARDLVALGARLHAPNPDLDEDDLDVRAAGGADLLPGWYDDWVVFERERLRQMRLHVLETVARRLTALGRYPAALEAALAAVRDEPLRESAHRAVVEVHLAEGNRTEAARHFATYRAMLADELGMAPTDTFAAMVHGVPSQRVEGATRSAVTPR